MYLRIIGKFTTKTLSLMLRSDRRFVSFDHSDEHQEVSIGSVEKETKVNKMKASKRDIIVVDDKSCWPGTVRESQRTLKM